MQNIKLNMSAKKTSTKKWWTWGYGLQFVNENDKTTGIIIKLKREQVENLLNAIKSNDLAKDNYGYYQFNLYPENKDNNYVKKENGTNSHSDVETLPLPNDHVPF